MTALRVVNEVVMELNGRPATDAELVSLALSNYGHFTSMLVENTRVRGLSLHLDRLVRDCRVLFGAELDPDLVRQRIRHAAEYLASPAVLRVTVFDPGLDLGRPGAATDPGVLVTSRTATVADPSPIRVRTRAHQRELPTVKHTGLLGTLYHRRMAQLDGYDDVLFTDAETAVSEGCTWNIAFVDGGRVVWPEADRLPGVTMLLVRELLRQRGIECMDSRITLDDLPRMSSAFVTNAAVGVRAVRSVDEVRLTTDHPLVDTLRGDYLALEGDPL